MKFYLKLVIILALLTGIMRWQSWFVPLNRDEGGYAYVASQLFTPNFVMYRDAFEHKPPLIDFIYWGSFLIFGQSDFAIHTLAFIFSTLTAVLFFFLVKKQSQNKNLALVATVMLIVFSNTFFLSGNGSNVEIFLSPLLLIAYWLLLDQKGFMAGIVLGCAVVLKPVAIINIGLAYLFLSSRFKLTLGWIIPVLTLILYEWFSGAFGDFFKAVFGFNAFYVKYGMERLPYNDNLFRVLVFPDPVLIVLVFGTLVLLWHHRPLILKYWKPIAWSLAIVIGVKILSREADHYYIPLLPALGLILIHIPKKAVIKLLTLALVLYSTKYLLLEFHSPKVALIQALGAEQQQRYDAREIGHKAKDLAHPGDVAHVSLIAEPELLFYAQLPSANRFFNTFAIDFYADGRQTILSTLAKQPLVVMAYSGIVKEFEPTLDRMGYRKDPGSYFAPVYWRPDAAARLGL